MDDKVEVLIINKDNILVEFRAGKFVEKIAFRMARDSLHFNSSAWVGEYFEPLTDDFFAIRTDDMIATLLATKCGDGFNESPYLTDMMGFDNFGKEVRFVIIYRLSNLELVESVSLGTFTYDIFPIDTVQDVYHNSR
jgi:NADH:ubiquinone oxidoreductase subunit C